MASDTYHEPLDLLTEQTRNMHRAIVSLMEGLEAIDWYQQRADACSDPHDTAHVQKVNDFRGWRPSRTTIDRHELCRSGTISRPPRGALSAVRTARCRC